MTSMTFRLVRTRLALVVAGLAMGLSLLLPSTGYAAPVCEPPVDACVDMSLTMSASPDPVAQDGQLVYTMTVVADTNAGWSASNVLVTDNLPDGLRFVNAGAVYQGTTTVAGPCSGPATPDNHGGTVTCNLGFMIPWQDPPTGAVTVQLTVVPTRPGTVSNTASVSTTSYETNLANNSATVTTTVNPPLADLGVAISGPSSARSGSQDTYGVTVSNVGPNTASNVVMTTKVPNGTRFVGVSATQGTCTHPASGSTSGTITCSLGNLAAGGAAIDSLSLKITLKGKGGNVLTVAQAYSSATNTTPATQDPNLANNVASFSTTVTK
jgi:uncharacterized repeat protein (TIGR01451 family)